MVYNIYTDGSLNIDNDKFSWSYLIFTSDEYIIWNGGKVEDTDVNTNTVEITAISLAFYWIANNRVLYPTDEIVIYTDSKAALLFYSKMNGKKSMCGNDKYLNCAYDNYHILANKARIKFVKVRGHRKKITPNILVDRLAKLYLNEEISCGLSYLMNGKG